jgi:glucose-6-phosphate 1-dehydrogenase
MSSPLTLVIFGASGDLTARKLVPSLYRLHGKGRLPAELRMVGVSRSPYSDAAYRERMAAAVKQFAAKWHAGAWDAFAARLFYVAADAATAAGLAPLQKWLDEKEGGEGGRRLYYLSVSPDLYPGIIAGLGQAGMARDDRGWRRVVIEKPFGRDLASAQALNRTVAEHFREDQVYRIDHYLGKDTVQNVLVFRFGNTLFEPLWNHKYIDSVQITVSESVLVGERGAFYDRTGVLRDMFQNHLLQLLTLVAMEAPARFTADQLRNEKVKVLEAVNIPTVDEACGNVVCGQYTDYRSEKGVSPDSRTPTFAAVKVMVDNWRWRGVPFYLRSGKGLSTRLSEVIIQFLCPPHLMFPLPAGQTLECNRLALCIQPDEGIHLNFQTKVPDHGMVLRPADLEFHYSTTYPDVPIPEAYERLLLDALNGEAHLFMRSDEIEQAWELMDPIIAATERPDAPAPQDYAVGSNGPACADEFIARDGRKWLSLCQH